MRLSPAQRELKSGQIKRTLEWGIGVSLPFLLIIFLVRLQMI